MPYSTQQETTERKMLVENIQHNCDISDARDHGIYSMCSMVLKLRNLYKWEQGVEPWEEPETGDLLDWIETKENHWADIAGETYRDLEVDGNTLSPDDAQQVNAVLQDRKLLYGSGYGRSMKAVFFLGQERERRSVEDCPVIVLGEEKAREMASPFAMVQDGVILIRRESLRFFFWDQLQELRSSCRSSLQHAYKHYGLLKKGHLDQDAFRDSLDSIVDGEMDLFVYHEVGEILQTTLDSETLQAMIGHFPGSSIEFVCRAVKDVLADTHPRGLLNHVIDGQQESTIGFYVGFLDGLRATLFPEMVAGWQNFLASGDWQHIEAARIVCRNNNLQRAEKIHRISLMIGEYPDDQLVGQFSTDILEPLGLDIPH